MLLLCFNFGFVLGSSEKVSDDLFIASLFAHEAFPQPALRFYADYGLLAAQNNTGQRLQLQRVVEYKKNLNIKVKITEIE